MKLLLAAIAAAAMLAAAHAQEAAMPDQYVLDKVPYIGPNWMEKLDGPQDFMFPSAMAALMKFLDPNHPYGYRFYLDVSGMAYRQLWHPTKWDCAMDNVWAIADDPVEPIRRCFEAAGFDFRVVGNREVCQGKPLIRDRLPEYADSAALRQAMMQTLRSGQPVIAMGLYSGAALVAGYEQKGEVLVGWTMAEPGQMEEDEHGYQRFPEWERHVEAIVIAGARREPLPLREVCRRAMVFAIEGSRSPQQGEYRAGQESFKALAEALQRDAERQADEATLKQMQLQRFFYSLAVAEGRAFGYDVLRRAADLEPAILEDVHRAVDCYDLMHDLVWRLWQTAGTAWNVDGRGEVIDDATAAELARVVLVQRDLDALATQHLSKAAAALGVSPQQLPPPTALEQRVSADFERRQRTSGANRAHLNERDVDLWVGPTPELRFMGGQDCTFVGALAAALATTERPVSYPDLMGYSGLAFRTRWLDNLRGERTAWGEGRWHPISPHGEGPEQLAAISRATGWEFRREEMPQDPNAIQRHRLVTDMVVSIREGLPIVVGRNTDLAAVYGYHIHSMNLFLRDYQHPQAAELRVPATDEGLWGPVVFLAGLGDQPAPDGALMESLRLAVSNGRRGPAEGFRYGLDGLAAWEQALGDYSQCGAEEQKLLFQVNWWCLMHLVDAREAAVKFLAAHADLVPAQARPAYTRAHDLYQREAALLQGFAQGNTRFIRWWGGTAQPADWTPEVQEAQRVVLRQCLDLEGQALAELAKVCGD